MKKAYNTLEGLGAALILATRAFATLPRAPRIIKRVVEQAYLGSFHELTVETGLGPIFVVSADTAQDWASGDAVTLSLTGRGVSVVPG